MKCNELMVGDWVADALGIPMQVISVGYTYAYAERNDENDYDWEEFEDKECKPCPILLTDEFFKKNDIDELAKTIEEADLLQDFDSDVWSCSRYGEGSSWVAYGGNGFAGNSGLSCSRLAIPVILYR